MFYGNIPYDDLGYCICLCVGVQHFRFVVVDKQSFACDLCGSRFCRPSDLRDHKDTVHTGKSHIVSFL